MNFTTWHHQTSFIIIITLTILHQNNGQAGGFNNQHRIAMYIFPKFFFNFQKEIYQIFQKSLENCHPSTGAFCPSERTSSFMPRFGGSEAVRRKAVGSLNSHPYRMGPGCYYGWKSKNRGGYPQKWMFEKNGKPYFLMDDLGGKPTIFGNIHIFSY